MVLTLMYQIKFASAQLFACCTNKLQICRLSLPSGGVVYNNNRMAATQPSLLLLCLWHHTHKYHQSALHEKTHFSETTSFALGYCFQQKKSKLFTMFLSICAVRKV